MSLLKLHLENHTFLQQDQLLRISKVVDLVALSRSTILRLESRNKFPQAIKLTERCVAYRLSQINEWMTDPDAYQSI